MGNAAGWVLAIAAVIGIAYWAQTAAGTTKTKQWTDEKEARTAVPPEAHCPTCDSHDIERIGRAKKTGAAAGVGVLAAGYLSKTFKCRNCGGRW